MTDQLRGPNAFPYGGEIEAVASGQTSAPRFRSKCVLPTVPGLADKFWAGVDVTGGTDGCWLWRKAVLHPDGYGMWSIRLAKARTVTWRAHRLAWALIHGNIPGDMMVCHRCDNPPCCNPAHLFLGTNTDNVRDMISKGRQNYLIAKSHAPLVWGEKHPNAKLTDAAVRSFRSRYRAGEKITPLAAELGMSTTALKAALVGRTWKHVS